MTFMFYTVGTLLVLFLLAVVFVRASPARIAGSIELAGPIVVGILGVGLMLAGRIGIGGGLASMAFAWFLSARRRRAQAPSPGRISTVRTAALEMELDHDTGGLEGIVLAGSYEGRQLSSLTRAELLDLRRVLVDDGESLQLVDTYLDGRFPGWREDAEADLGRGEGVSPGSGPMTEQEAYKILGLEPGAPPAEIRKAHRRLMQRLHPDLGGTTFLAARINEAKDVLLSTHH